MREYTKDDQLLESNELYPLLVYISKHKLSKGPEVEQVLSIEHKYIDHEAWTLHEKYQELEIDDLISVAQTSLAKYLKKVRIYPSQTFTIKSFIRYSKLIIRHAMQKLAMNTYDTVKRTTKMYKNNRHHDYFHIDSEVTNNDGTNIILPKEFNKQDDIFDDYIAKEDYLYICSTLTELEKRITNNIKDQYDPSLIAKIYGITPQAVSLNKIEIVRKIRAYFKRNRLNRIY